MRFGLMVGRGAKKSVERLLKQVVRELAVAGDASEIRPEPARRPIVKLAEGVLVHENPAAASKARSRWISLNVVARSMGEIRRAAGQPGCPAEPSR